MPDPKIDFNVKFDGIDLRIEAVQKDVKELASKVDTLRNRCNNILQIAPELDKILALMEKLSKKPARKKKAVTK